MTGPFAHCVDRFLEQVHLGPRQAHKALTLWPLLRPGAPAGLDYVPLCDALEDGFVGVDALAREGPAEGVRLENRAGCAVLVLRGEELPGAGPGRVARASLLVPPRDVRVLRLARARRLPPVHGLRPLPGQVGFVAAVGEAVVGLEAVARPQLLARHFASLLRPHLVAGAAADRRRPVPPATAFDAPEPFLAALRAAPPGAARHSAGLGHEVGPGGGPAAGLALAVGDELVHLSAWPASRS